MGRSTVSDGSPEGVGEGGDLDEAPPVRGTSRDPTKIVFGVGVKGTRNKVFADGLALGLEIGKFVRRSKAFLDEGDVGGGVEEMLKVSF